MVVCATSLFWLIFTPIISWYPVAVVVIKGGSGVGGWGGWMGQTRPDCHPEDGCLSPLTYSNLLNQGHVQ